MRATEQQLNRPFRPGRAVKGALTVSACRRGIDSMTTNREAEMKPFRAGSVPLAGLWIALCVSLAGCGSSASGDQGGAATTTPVLVDGAAAAAAARTAFAGVNWDSLSELQRAQRLSMSSHTTMEGPYEMTRNWPTLPEDMTWGAAIGLLPDGTGGLWMLFRSEPAIVYINAEGQVTKRFGEGVFVQAHGFCMDRDGNLWAGDSGPFGNDPSAVGRGFQLHKFSQDGELLMSLGQAGVSRAGEDTFIGPTACAIAPNGNIIVADGHWPRPTTAQQDGDRLVEITTDGRFVRSVGKMGTGPGEFMGPHDLAYDNNGRLFVADRSNNRILILDQDLNFVDQWKQFGRPSGVTILSDATMVVADSESGANLAGPVGALDGLAGGTFIRNPGHQMGIRIGDSRNGSLRYFIPGTRPEGMAADELGNIFAGLTGGCNQSPSGGCLQKWVPIQ